MRTATWLFALLMLQGCTAIVVGSAVVSTATSVAVETAKVPFKVAGTAIDIVTDDEDPDDADRADTEDE